MSATLIQIVSEETMPNLLAAMAIKPKRIVHLCTPAMAGASAALERAYGQAWVKTSVVTRRLGEHPGMVELNDAVGSLIRETGDAVVNFTGGTKLMSIGAYAAATRAKAPSVYVDTAAGEFVNGLSGGDFKAIFPNGTAISQVSRQLTVNGVATANGVERVSSGKTWKEYAPLADFLLRNPAEEQKCHDAVADLLKKEPRNFQQSQAYYKNLYARRLAIPDAVGERAAAAGLMEKRANGFYPASKWFSKFQGFDLSCGNVPSNLLFGAVEEARWPFSFFNGNWWEIAVMRYLAEQGRYRDLRWSVDAGSRMASSTDMEEDILGIDGVNLLYVSCKRGGDRAKLSRVLEDVNSSARRLGGKFAHKILAVFIDLQGVQRKRLENRCRELHIELLDRATVACA